MTAKELKEKYIDFFVKKGHKKLPNVSLVPENDPTALFISAGMHPLVPYLLGESHPLGKRLVSNQRCLRTVDIDKVGNTTHHTFFEMLGNWSLGDYWKKEAIEWSWEFLTKKLNLDPKRISVSVFAGDKETPGDEESAKIWRSLGIPSERIYFFPKKNNWWGPVGESGPCGPDTEMFYDVTGKSHGSGCKPEDGCGRFFEIWNDVFMEYAKTPKGKFNLLKQKNVDTGMGVERTVAVLQGKDDNYQTELFATLINQIEKISGKKYQGENKKLMRIIADHLRAATFAIADGVMPSNVEQGYVLRRLIRRAIVKEYGLEGRPSILVEFLETGYKLKPAVSSIIDFYKTEYPYLEKASTSIQKAISGEWEKFGVGLRKGHPVLLKILEKSAKVISGKDVFRLFDTYGIQPEVTEQAAQKAGRRIDKKGFEREFKRHQKISRAGLEKKFAGGLADHSEEVTKLHTTTHLLHQALRDVLGSHVQQVGSNITPKRLRFDFTHPEKLSELEIKKIEKLVNQKVKENLPVKMKMMTFAEAKKKGALAFFGERYGEKVKVYSIGSYSQEVCGGPHVSSTGKIGSVKIIKEQAVGAGRRRIYAQLVPKP